MQVKKMEFPGKGKVLLQVGDNEYRITKVYSPEEWIYLEDETAIMVAECAWEGIYYIVRLADKMLFALDPNYNTCESIGSCTLLEEFCKNS